MNLKNLSNSELHLQTVSKANCERLATLEVLWHLRENERRLLYAEMGFRDLKEYCVKELKYSEGSAWRRISAMRVLKEVPEIQEKIQSGNLNLTQISLARRHFREVKSSLPEKREILLSIENQSIKSTERILCERSPESLTSRPEESERPVSGQKLEVTFILDEDLQKDLREIEILLGKPYSKLELFKLMTKRTLVELQKNRTKTPKLTKPMVAKTEDKLSYEMNFLEAHNPKASHETEVALDVLKQTATERKAQPLRSQAALRSRHVPSAVRRQVAVRDQNQCRYRDPVTGRRCEARLYLQMEHLVPFAKGGGHDPQNLQLLCASHNRLRAVQQFGGQKMRGRIFLR
jgi:5-methylcytosine-specific restriction endonuclease McrA